MKKYSIFWLPFSRELCAGERASRFSIFISAFELQTYRWRQEGGVKSEVLCQMARGRCECIGLFPTFKRIKWTWQTISGLPVQFIWLPVQVPEASGYFQVIPTVRDCVLTFHQSVALRAGPLLLYLGCSHLVKTFTGLGLELARSCGLEGLLLTNARALFPT